MLRPEPARRGARRRVGSCLSLSPRTATTASGCAMAIFHLQITPVSRGRGGSATASAAYQAGERIRDERTGITFNYSRRSDVEHRQIVVPVGVAGADAAWLVDRKALWNAVELAETRGNARVAREYIVALPHELTSTQRLELAQDFALRLANRYGVVTDLAVHRATRDGDARNVHAHLLTSTRELGSDGFGAKSSIERARDGFRAFRQQYVDVRASWADLANDYLARYGHEARIDHRSLAAQGIDRRPATHLGPAVIGMSRRGILTDVQQRIALEARHEQELRRGAGMASGASWAMASPRAQLTPALPQAGAEADRHVGHSPHEAAARWLQGRAAPARHREPAAAAPAHAHARERSDESGKDAAVDDWRRFRRDGAIDADQAAATATGRDRGAEQSDYVQEVHAARSRSRGLER